jgi:hypothetical protein
MTITTIEGGYIYNCYRASCERKYSSGLARLALSIEQRLGALKTRQEKVSQEDVAWQVPDYWIDGIGDAACHDYMVEKHMMQAYKEGLFRPMYDPAERRFIFPIKDSLGHIIGAVGKTLIRATPKIKNYNRTFTRPFTCGKFPKAIIVEDCASAVAATRAGYTGIALLGTHLKKDFIEYLSAPQYTSLGIALDPDAYSKSIQMKKVLDSYVKNVYILRLPKDIKDATDEELKGVLCT